MSKIYLPEFNNNNCIVVDNLNNGYIRVYETTPTINSSVNYIDYFIDKDYITRTGTQTFGSYNVNVNCQNVDNFTTDFYYRVDIEKSFIIFVIMFFFIVIIPYKIMSRIFGRWLKI